jgi:hypothetical protein
MNGEHLIIALIAAIGPTWMASAAWRNTRQVGNGWTVHVTEELGEIKGLLKAHIDDKKAHNTDPRGMVR